MIPGNRMRLATPFRNLPYVDRVPHFANGQDRPLDLSISSLRGIQCQPIDLRRRRGTRVNVVSRGASLRRAWHHVRLNRSNEPLPCYSPPETCHSFKPKFILQKESASDVESSSHSNTSSATGKVQNNLFGGTTHCPTNEKVSTSNTTFPSQMNNPFKKIEALPEPPSKCILGPSKLGGFSNSGSNFVFGSTILKQSSFSSLTGKPQMDTFKLKPSVLSNSSSKNLFKRQKLCGNIEEDSSLADKSESKSADEPENKEDKTVSEETTESAPSTKDNAESNNQVPLFVPLSSQTESIKSSDDSKQSNGLSTATPQSGFIFGQNLISTTSNKRSGFFGVDSTSGETQSTNLFSEAFSDLPTDQKPQEDWTAGKSLVETSRELTERVQNQKRKYEEVEVLTGEEDESNVIQMLCKLYSWLDGSWRERGRGILRLNDKAVNSELFSRLVVRTQGTLTIILNTKVWADMSVEKVNEKSVMLTACDADGQPKIFMIMGAPKDVEILHTSLDYRILETKQQLLKLSQNEENT